MTNTAPDPATVPDRRAREAVRHDLDRTLFVEAGAGSGKTACLVDRFVALVESGVGADRIAAITFTEKAARELGDRIRTELEHKARQGSARCADGLDGLDQAAIGTLHAFARRILTEHPIEAGLPPRISVLDEIGSQLAFEERWHAYVDGMLEDPDMERPFRLLLAAGGTLQHLHDVATIFEDSWDLVEERMSAVPVEVPDVDVSALLVGLDAVADLALHCHGDGDLLAAHLEGPVRDLAQGLRDAVDDDARLCLLDVKLTHGNGKRGNWGVDIDGVRARLRELHDECAEVRQRVLRGVLAAMAESLARFTVEGARSRRRSGELEFHDLLVLARQVLRDPDRGPSVRAAVGERYQRQLLDEFQDTDPIQVELAVLIASADPTAGGKDWWDVAVEPGRLFFVGDPKQSIYRFRRADIAVFLKARDALVGCAERLTTNFRTGQGILDWVNATFAELIRETPDSQPAYVALDHHRPAPPCGPGVAFVGTEHPVRISADDLREAEAADVTTSVRRAVAEGWSVGERRADGSEAWREATWSDIAILLPARTSLPALEQALGAAGVPYRAETSSLVYGTREVRDLLVVARAVEDPTDSLAVVAALRTAAFGCGDDDLFTWKVVHGGRWDHQGALGGDAPLDHPVPVGLAWIGELHRERFWLSPSQVLERIVRERRLLELAVADLRPRDLWRRLRFVLDQCRAWEEAGGATLREYLHWAELQSAEGSRVIETVLPESDDDAVRILTVHGAKGLEFPITVLSGMTTLMRWGGRGVQVRFPPAGGWAIQLRKGVSTAEFELFSPIDEQMDRHERLRLLYVAATRARDHLVVSVHRKQGDRSEPTSAEVLHRAGHGAGPVELLTFADDDDEVASDDDRAGTEPAPAPPRLPSVEHWRRERSAVLTAAGRPRAVSATRLAEAAAARAVRPAGLEKDPRDIDLPPWQKGRYGTAIGRAVHAVLQTVDLASGGGLSAAVSAQAAAEGVIGKEDVIEALCRSALAADVVRRAAGREHWREVYVGCPYGDGVLEGYVDLLYRDDDGLVVVDYKTDGWRTEADLDAKVERGYAVQLQAYAHAVATAVAEPVNRALLLFLGRDRSATRLVPPAALAPPDPGDAGVVNA